MRTFALALLLAGCGGSAAKPAPVAPVEQPVAQPPPAPEPPPPPPLDPPPWADAPPSGVPKVYATEWVKAKNRATCPLMVLSDLGPEGEGAKARRANFAGGWGIAYDKKGQRGAFGIAGTGVSKDGTQPTWPSEIKWSDGSHVGYGPEGGTGPNSLAYLHVEGSDCLYNVWSAVGDEHLVTLLKGLRKIEAKK